MIKTFLFTDIEGSTIKWQNHPHAMKDALAEHDRIIKEEIARFAGRLVKHTGDGCMAAFHRNDALVCALSIQERLTGADWSAVNGLSVRIGIDSGEIQERNGDFFGPVVNRAARITSAGWGGQILVGGKAASSLRIPDGGSLVDMGVHMVRDLLEPQQIFSLSHPGLRSSFPPLRTVSAHPGNLPIEPTPFIGREIELKKLGNLLKTPSVRLITILAGGGMGKTRTAIQAAAANTGHFRHGTWFVPLQDASGEGAVLSAIAESLSYRFKGRKNELEQLADFISNREILLILDNFEHLQSHSPIVTGMVSSGPGVKVLVTSRHRLGLREETVFDLPGLSEEGMEAAGLFLGSAERSLPGFTPDEGELNAIRKCCGLLGGNPLAIELAASWVRTISCSEILQELERSTEILEVGEFHKSGRHGSMKSVFLYSWELLRKNERTALAGLSVFEGGFTREAASAVAGCGLKTLQALCDRSLVSKTAGNRYDINRTTLSLASEKKHLVPGIEDRFVEFWQEFLEWAKPRLSSADQSAALDSISAEYPNIRRAALIVCKTLNRRLIHLFSSSLSILLQLRSRFTEGVELFTELLEAAGSAEAGELDKEKPRAILLERLSTFLLMSGRIEQAEKNLLEASGLSETIGDTSFHTLCKAGLGNISYMKKNYAEAERHWEEALETASGDHDGNLASLLCNLANARKRRGDVAGALEILDRAEKKVSKTGDINVRAAFLSTRGEVSLLAGKPDSAEACFLEALELNRNTGNPRGVSFCLENLARIAEGRSLEEALPLAEESFAYAVKSGVSSRIGSSERILEELRRRLASP